MKERQLTTLIVSGAPEERAVLHDALSRDTAASYVVTEAESGARALELCRELSPDFVILDHDLPDLSGLDVLKKLAAEEWATSCAVVMLIGAGEAQLAVEAMNSGAHDCLEKGRARGAELLRAVGNAIERAEQRRRGEARERELIEENLALETRLAAFQREAAGREEGAEAWRVARAGVRARGETGSHPMSAFYDQAEEQLRSLKTAIEQSNESVIVTTAQLEQPGPQIIYVNPAFTRMTGYALEEVIGKTPRILQGPKTDRSALDRLRKECAAGKIFHGEMINYRKDRSEHYLEWTAGPVRNERGEVTHFAAALRDVTERRRVEEALRNSEAQLRTILDYSSAVIFVKDLEGRYLRINRRYKVLHGVTEAEAQGKTDYDIHAREVADAVRANDQEVIAANTPLQFEKRVATAEGQRQFISLKFPLYDDSGRTYAVCGVATDITERKQAEEALRESQALNQAVLGSVDANIAVLDRDGNIIAVNDAWKRFARENGGAAIADSVGVNYLAVCRRGQKEDNLEVKVALDGIQAVLDGARPNFIHEYPCHSPGEKRWFLMSVTPLIAERGGVVVTHTNITVRKLAEEALQKSEGRLRRIAEATQDVLWEIDPRTRRLWWSERAGPLFGFHAAEFEIELEDWYDRIHPEDVDRIRTQFEKFLQDDAPVWVDEYRFRRADGAYIYMFDLGRKYYLENGPPVLISGAMSDITERNQAEKALRDSEERFRSLIEQASGCWPVFGNCSKPTTTQFSCCRKIGSRWSCAARLDWMRR